MDVLNGIVSSVTNAPGLALLAQAMSPQSVAILASYSVLSVVIIGFTASLLVFLDSRRMQGGIFGTALLYFSIGMFCLLIGYIAGILEQLAPNHIVIEKLVHDVLFIVGYVLMAAGAHKIYQTIGKKP